MRGVQAVTDIRVVDHPGGGLLAAALRALALRRPRSAAGAARRVLIGGDSTDASHSDGAIPAAQRMAATILAGSPERACELEQTRSSAGSVPG